jgi:hypothetical protein
MHSSSSGLAQSHCSANFRVLAPPSTASRLFEPAAITQQIQRRLEEPQVDGAGSLAGDIA